MDTDGLPIIGLGIDYTKVESISTKRMLTFMNHFITQTVSFLNRFSSVCDERLEALSTRMQRLDTMMCILETKLASIPGLENVTLPTSTAATASAPLATDEQQPTAVVAALSSQNTTSQSSAAATQAVNTGSLAANDKSTELVETTTAAPVIDPRYARYFQMIKMGVPLAAIRQKVVMDGLDPAVLENPSAAAAVSNAAAAAPAQATAAASTNQKSGGGDKDSDSDFSDISEHSSSEDEGSSGFDD